MYLGLDKVARCASGGYPAHIARKVLSMKALVYERAHSLEDFAIKLGLGFRTAQGVKQWCSRSQGRIVCDDRDGQNANFAVIRQSKGASARRHIQ